MTPVEKDALLARRLLRRGVSLKDVLRRVNHYKSLARDAGSDRKFNKYYRRMFDLAFLLPHMRPDEVRTRS